MEDIIINSIDDIVYNSKSNLILPNINDLVPTEMDHLSMELFTYFIDYIILSGGVITTCGYQSQHISEYFVEINFNNFEMNIPNILVETIRNCMKFTRFFIIPVKLIFSSLKNIGHANIIIVDTQEQTIEFFEPHGSVFLGQSVVNIENIIKKVVDMILPTHSVLYRFTNVQADRTCIGIQTKQSQIKRSGGYCLAWSLLFAYLRVINLNLSANDIIKYFINETPEFLDIFIRKFITFVGNKVVLMGKIYTNIPHYDMKKHLTKDDIELIKQRIYQLIELYKASANISNKDLLKEIFEELVSYRHFDFFQDYLLNYFVKPKEEVVLDENWLKKYLEEQEAPKYL